MEGREASHVIGPWDVQAADCLAAMLPKRSERLAVLQELGRTWGVPEPQVEYLHALARPQVHHTTRGLHVGRIVLEPYSSDGPTDSNGGLLSQAQQWSTQGVPAAPGMGFSATGGVARVMEAVAACVASREPALLVGETGTGKTTVVQHLARLQKRRVTVLVSIRRAAIRCHCAGRRPPCCQLSQCW